MPVLMTAEVAGQTEQGYDGMLQQLQEALRGAPGFLMHGSHPVEGGWRVFEVWNSREEANRFYAQHVAPHLPPGIRPKRTVQELHSLVRA